MQASASVPTAGDFVEVRTRRWLVESVSGAAKDIDALEPVDVVPRQLQAPEMRQSTARLIAIRLNGRI
jgi:hypothetical protein